SITATDLPLARSQMRRVESQPPVKSCLPSGENASPLTWAVCPVSEASSFPALKSQTRTVESLPLTTRRLPSGVKAMWKTTELAEPNLPSCLREATSHSRTCEAPLALNAPPPAASVLPSGEKATV